ncbi:MAG: GNAT family N-acetyltransferase [Anaerolineae bacterium]|nr:GNAT family N-acetyltransferase [Anaerolineae bacterium]
MGRAVKTKNVGLALVRRALLTGALVTLITLPVFSWGGLFIAAGVMTLMLSRWVRHHRLREVCEIGALLPVGLAWLAHMYAQNMLLLAAGGLSLFALAVAVASVPRWKIEVGKQSNKRAGCVQRAGLRDLPEMLRLIRLSFGRMPVSPALLAWFVLRRGCYAVRDDRYIIGCVATFPLAGDAVWVELLAVHPDYQRRGTGAQLLDGLGEVYLVVRAGNEGALAFYRRVGFEVVEVWSGYYGDGEDGEVLFHKETTN